MQRHTVTRATIYLRVWPRRRNAFALYTGKQLAASVKEVRGKKNTPTHLGRQYGVTVIWNDFATREYC